VIVCFADIGGKVDHHCLEVVVCFVDIGVNCHQYQQNKQSPPASAGQQFTSISTKRTITLNK
jgi:hypothetical protein